MDDLILLRNPNEESITTVLENRYKEDLIHTYIGPVCVSLNPYKKIKDLYSNETKHAYHSHYPYELAPHLYSLAEDAYRTMKDSGRPQTVIISGESGAGKTEASKIMMEFIAAVSVSGLVTESIKKAILECNPVLEAFGNAKTLRNDNSSRFGKYMDLFFNFKGQLEGGHITTSLLEKSRVVVHRPGERNFHIFYQICTGADDLLRRELFITNPKTFKYIAQSATLTVDGVDDRQAFRDTKQAMFDMGITITEQMEIFRVIAAVLHLGNIEFKDVMIDNQECAELVNPEQLTRVAQILQLEEELLLTSLTKKTIQAGNSFNFVAQNADKAAYNRDALAKAMYERLFNWLVRRVNIAIKRPDDARFSIGILDIYGFEIHDEKNSFEQLCINFVNEKIQQQIQAWLKEEQEEYVQEGVPWRDIKHSNCEDCVKIIEDRPIGVYALLDEECMFPDGKDSNYLSKMNANFGKNNLYQIPRIKRGLEFGLQHFAATVPYDVEGWVDKNRDTLLADIIYAMQTSQSEIIKQLFPSNEIITTKGKLQNTLSNQFRQAVNGLVGKITGKKAHFVRCLKPNHEKKADSFNHQVVLDQVKYLGLVENVFVRRAGYYYKIEYEKFLERYKLCSPNTWPKWNGSARDGSEAILKHMKLDGKYALGKTKVFIQSPIYLFMLDDKVQSRLDEMATLIQRTWRRYRTRNTFLEATALKKSLDEDFSENTILYKTLAAEYDDQGRRARRLLIVGERALYTIDPTSFVVHRRIDYSQISSVFASILNDGMFFVKLNQAARQEGEADSLFDVDVNKTETIRYLMDAYQKTTSGALNLELGDKLSWYPQHNVEQQARWDLNPAAAHVFVSIDDAGDLVINVKPMQDVFDGKKLRRRASFGKQMQGDYLRLQQSPLMDQLNKDYGDTTVHFSAIVSKFNKSYKPEERVLMITDKALYNVDPHGYMVNRRVPLRKIAGACVSVLTDGFFIVQIPDEYDYVFASNKKTEVVQTLSDCYSAATRQNLRMTVKNVLKHTLKKGEVKEIHFHEDPDVEDTTLVPAPHGADVLVRIENIIKDAASELEMIKDIYEGRKMRRRGTLLRLYTGDYLYMDKSKWLKQVAQKYGDKKILFSGVVNKINKRYKVQERKLIITDQAIYNMDKDGTKVNRRIGIQDINAISVSTLRDGFFVVRVNDDYDYFYESYKKTEIVRSLMDQYYRTTGKQLLLTIDDEFEYIPDKSARNIVKVIEFKVNNDIIGSLVEPTSKGVLVSVNNMDDAEEFSNAEIGMSDRADSVFTGRKMRRRSSFDREYLGDYLRLAETANVKKLFKQYGDKGLLFSGNVDKINKTGKRQQRVLLISDKAIYNVDPEHFRVKRRIPLDDIDGVSLSSLTDGFFVMHVPKEYDYMYDSDKKTEIVDILSEAISRNLGRDIRVNIGDKFEYSPNGREIKNIAFVLDENVSSTTLEGTNNGLVVHVRHEEPSVVLECALIHIKDQPKPIEVRTTPILIKLKKRWRYKLEIRFYVNEPLSGCKFHEKIDTISTRREYVSQVADLAPRDERYVILLPERDVMFSLLSKTRVKAKLVDPMGKVLLAVRFVYDVR